MSEDRNGKGWLASLPNDSVAKTLIVAIGLCLICSVVVSATAVALKPLQLRNAILARQIEILRVAGLMEEGGDVEVLFQQVEVRVVDLDSGEFVDDIDGATYDQRKAARDPSMSDAVPPDDDVAGIQRRARYAPIYLVKDGDAIETIILPIHGYGLWSTMYGFLALEGNARTVRGLTFYEDGETPGLGGEINNPRWQARWVGRQLVDNQGEVRLRVIRGSPDPDSPEAIHQVDGISGATLTVNGVNNAIEYWFSDRGFGPFLARLREQGDAT
jgi:Na+-transporting NADH:ubiquinone oxidoreductase subunit C